jgi:hypothetical protein
LPNKQLGSLNNTARGDKRICQPPRKGKEKEKKAAKLLEKPRAAIHPSQGGMYRGAASHKKLNSAS